MQSLGNLYHFNATCELAIANEGSSYTPPAYLQQFENDIELLPIYLTSSNDYLLVNKAPSPKYLAHLKELKPDLPTVDTTRNLINLFESGSQLNNLKPWGWSLNEHKLLKPFKKFTSAAFQSQPNANWQKEHKHLYSRENAWQVLTHVIKSSSNIKAMIPQKKLPQKVDNFNEILRLQKQWEHLVIKAPWSASGSNSR